MPTDRAQDTEAIRAALAFGRARAIATVIADNPPAHTLADEVAVETAQFDDAIVKFERLVARLEAAERERDEARGILARFYDDVDTTVCEACGNTRGVPNPMRYACSDCWDAVAK